MLIQATFPTPSLTIAGRVFTDLSNLIQLVAFVNGVGTGFCTFRKIGGVGGYTPSGAKSFRLAALQVEPTVAFATAGSIFYSDNDLGVATNTAPINPVYPGGASGTGQSIPLVAASNGSVVYQKAIDFTVINGKFLGITTANQNTTGSIYAWGYEI